MSQTKETVLVVGSSRGIGAAIANRYLKEGFRVAATSRSGNVPAGAAPIKVDVLNSDGRASEDALRYAVDAALAELGGISVAVYNAGITRDSLLMGMPAEDLRLVIETNLVAPMLFSKALLRPMTKQRHGSLMFVSSMSARFGVPGQTNYTASKAGLEGFVRSFAKEWAPRGIRANAVAPGPTETEMFDRLTTEQRESLLADTPIRRAATADEIAEVVFHTSLHTYQSGSVVPISGGGGYGY